MAEYYQLVSTIYFPPHVPVEVWVLLWLSWVPCISLAVKRLCPNLCPPSFRAPTPESPLYLLGVFKKVLNFISLVYSGPLFKTSKNQINVQYCLFNCCFYFSFCKFSIINKLMTAVRSLVFVINSSL